MSRMFATRRTRPGRSWACWIGLWAITWSLASLLGCGGESSPRPGAQLRLVNATSASVPLDISAQGVLVASSVQYGEASPYVRLDPAVTDLSITLSTASHLLLPLRPQMSDGGHYTVVVFGDDGTLQAALIDDDADAADPGQSKLRVLNASMETRSIDVYVTLGAESLDNPAASYTNATWGQLSDYSTLNAAPGTLWRVRVVASGDRTDLRLDAREIALPDRSVSTLVITPAPGGVLARALLIEQAAEVSRLDNRQARVRAAGPNSGVHTASIAGTLLIDGASGPAIGDYRLVDAGDLPVTLSIDGVTMSPSSATLTAGFDYTLLVYRNSNLSDAYYTRLIVDDNRVAAAADTAKLRLVHGVDTRGVALEMRVDGSSTGYVLLPGASDYRTLPTAQSTNLSVYAANDSVAFYRTTVSLQQGAVYSVFAVGGRPWGEGGLVWRDR